jgi:hypothetical protein
MSLQKNLSVAVFGIVAALVSWPMAASAQTCCQLPGSCFAINSDSTDTCVAEGGSPTSGSCNTNTGLCGGTTVCCGDQTSTPPECMNATAATCALFEDEPGIQYSVCGGDGKCTSTCGQITCPTGQVVCGGGAKCADLSVDNSNCGFCGRASQRLPAGVVLLSSSDRHHSGKHMRHRTGVWHQRQFFAVPALRPPPAPSPPLRKLRGF